MGSTAFRFVSKALVTGTLTLTSMLTACGDDDDGNRTDESPATGSDASVDAGEDAGEGGAPVSGDASGLPFDAATDAGSVDASGTTEFDGAAEAGGGPVAEAGADARAQEPGASDAAADSAQPGGSPADAAPPDAQAPADAGLPPATDSATPPQPTDSGAPQPTDSGATPQPTDSGTPQPVDSGAVSDAQVDGGTAPGAGDAAVDSGPGSGDASASSDASATPDASASGDAGAPGSCDPRFGCGESDGDWVHFESGFSYDRSTGLVWARAGTTSGNQNNRFDDCSGIDLAGVGAFRVPTVQEVARLSAGCSPCLEGVGDCQPCEAGDGPHVNGGYCRPEFPDCQAVFTADTCEVGSTTVRCPSPRHWYYDERIGIFRLLDTGDSVPGTCVAQVTTPVP